MSQINLYYQTQLDTKVPLLPYQLTNNIDDAILENLISQVKGKTTENGIVIRVFRLIDYDYGIIDGNNFAATTNYNVKYECLLCSPVKDLEIVCVLDNIIKGYLLGTNGPVTIAVQYSNIDTNNFYNDGSHIKYNKTGKILSKNDYIKVAVIKVNSDMGENSMLAICKLIDLANDEDIRRYKDDQRLISDINPDANRKTKFI
jgi:DNA-directed RNA polymerase subunit E'/Rpb7